MVRCHVIDGAAMRGVAFVLFVGAVLIGPRDPWEWTLITYGAAMAVLAMALVEWTPGGKNR